MKLYRYFKGHNKRGHWYPVEVGTDAEKKAFENPGYGFCTVMAMGSTKGTAEEPDGDLFYQGPFYIDIDTDGDIGNSLKVAKTTVKQLQKQGINADLIDVWLSGKKGFHITVPQGVFTEDAPVRDLPRIYKALTLTFGLRDIDSTVYSLRKGRMWRLPSRKRIDNDAYKVIASVEELLAMKAEAYRKLCAVESRPFEAVEFDQRKRNPKLKAMFDFAVLKAGEERPPVVTLIDDNMRNALGEDIMPPCAIDLRDNQNTRDNRGFNDKSVQMMKAVRAFVPADQQKSTLEEFATNATGDSYGTEESRLDHVRRSFNSVATGNDYVWSCRSILSVLKTAPCDNCPLVYLRYQQQDAEDEEIERRKSVPLSAAEADSEDSRELTDAAQALADGGSGDEPPDPPEPPGKPSGAPKPRPQRVAPTAVTDTSENLTIFEHAYAFIAQTGGFRRVTNFVIKITKVYIEHIANRGEDRRVAVEAEVYVLSKYVGTVIIEEDAWNSNAAFTNSFNGIANLTFLGDEKDIRRMKSSLLKDIEKTTVNIRRVHSYGVHHDVVANQDVYTYVEPNWSINNYGQENLYSLSGRLVGAPKLQYVMPLVAGENDPETTECFNQLVSINQKYTVALLLGWTMASFMKQHIFAYTNEFPLVSLSGNAQAGKTQTSGLFAALHGVHYVGGTGAAGDKASPVSLGGSGATTFATWTSLSESMTVPKLIEEFNQRSLGKKYEEYVEHFKKAWNQHAVKRGTIRNAKSHGTGPIDAYTIDIPLTAPTLLMGEQSVVIPALVQRCIQIQMNEDQRHGPGMEEAFGKLKAHYTYFDRFAKTAYMEVVNISTQQVKEWVSEWTSKIPFSIGDRPHHSFCVCLAGLSFLKHMDAKYALHLGDIIAELINTIIETVNMTSGDIARHKSHSEVDRLMNEFAVMAELSRKSGADPYFTKGQFYLRDGRFLYLDGFASHSAYVRFTSRSSQLPIIATYQQFKELIRHSSYCETIAATLDNFANGRQVIKLNLAKMAERGIEIDCFEGM